MGICKDRAFDVLKKISFERIAGTPEELRCAEMLKEECEKYGVPAVIEAFEIDTPEVQEAKLVAHTADGDVEFTCIGIGKSGQTPDEGFTAPLLYAEDGLEANLIDAKGKILLLNAGVNPQNMKKIRECGALGYISCHGSLYDPEEMIPEIRTRNEFGKKDGDPDFPGVVVHITDAQKLLRLYPESVTIVVKQDAQKKGTSHNVVATIQGTEKPEEIIAFSAHYDSVIYSSGAWDNGTGSLTILELMHYFLANPPKRTLKFVWCGAEEIGCRGSAAYCKDHKDELDKYLFNINVDMTGTLLGYEKAVCSCDDVVAKHIEYLGKVVGFPITTSIDLYASDSTSFAGAGVPAMTFARLNPRGGAEIHSRRDVMEHLDPTAFIKTVEFMALFSDELVNAKLCPVPRALPEDLQKKLEERKKMFGEDKKEEKKEEKAEEKAEEKK